MLPCLQAGLVWRWQELSPREAAAEGQWTVGLNSSVRVSLENLSCSVNGQLNGIDIVGQDLHCYVVTEDGRTYTAISRISDTLGWQMQVQYCTVQYSTVHYSTVQVLMI